MDNQRQQLSSYKKIILLFFMMGLTLLIDSWSKNKGRQLTASMLISFP